MLPVFAGGAECDAKRLDFESEGISLVSVCLVSEYHWRGEVGLADTGEQRVRDNLIQMFLVHGNVESTAADSAAALVDAISRRIRMNS
ncbi:hypothetical protein [uncultured Microbacterium sp.]|uniref:hypothetical protein n=1 Tax=uncultured Microbacterium sp. TaxID=191216 RepID=UPI0025EC1B43|nr:hypothetical protein [uncultured Microbacterium sp.]